MTIKEPQVAPHDVEPEAAEASDTADSSEEGGSTIPQAFLEDPDAEIDSAREAMKEFEDDEEEEEEEEASVPEEGQPEYEKLILKVQGLSSSNSENLRKQLTGKISLSVTDEKTGFSFNWGNEKLQVEKWTGTPPADVDCLVELSSSDLGLILRGKLNPQIAMLSHKVKVSGQFSQAVYLFNLFS